MSPAPGPPRNRQRSEAAAVGPGSPPPLAAPLCRRDKSAACSEAGAQTRGVLSPGGSWRGRADTARCWGGWAGSESPPSVGQPPNPPGVTAAPGQPQPCATGPWFAAGGDGTGHGDGLSGAGGSPLPPQDGARGRTPLHQGASTGNGEFQGDLAPVLGREGSRQPVHLPRPQTVARGTRHRHHLPCGGENGSPPRSSPRRNPIHTRPHPQGGVGLPPAPQPP